VADADACLAMVSNAHGPHIEQAVTRALVAMKRTRLVIAHRPETIAGAQRVVIVKDGQVVDYVDTVRLLLAMPH